MSNLVVALAQDDPWLGDIAGNAQRVIETARQARDGIGADVVVFPELFLTGYPPEDLLLRADMVRLVQEALHRLLDAIQGIHVVLGLPHYAIDPKPYNSAAVFRDGEILGLYHKHILPNYNVFDEWRYFLPGTEPCVFTLKGRRLGITICEDIWTAVPASRALAAGAELLININASPYHHGKSMERQRILRARCNETGLPIAYVNMVGGQDELVFDGQSLVLDHRGQVVFHDKAFAPSLSAFTWQEDNTLHPHQPSASPPDNEVELVYEALRLGIRDYVQRNGFQGALVGLSGGVDSALTLALATDTLGSGDVMAVLMPSPHTSAMSMEDALAEVHALGVRHEVLPIDEPMMVFGKVLAPVFTGLPQDSTEENIQARCRGILLMALSNKLGKIVLATGNKSEMACGYTTLYGDLVGGFAPLKDVPKQMVYQLSRHRNSQGAVIPERVLNRPPSAELRPDQKDADSLPPYEILDPILELYVEQELPIEAIVARGYEEQTVLRVAAMVKKAEYKRRQAPPGIKISRRAFGRDRRYPITSAYPW
jgi:NAD+ synthase (glutamine-hydrolysing)